MGTPLVSVFWISGYRGDSVVRLIERFLNQTSWPNLELLVVDWSTDKDQLGTRDHLKGCQHINKLLLREKHYCVFNNFNLARKMCEGEYILCFEDDSRLVDNISPSWLELLLERMSREDIDDVNLWSHDYMPPTLAALSRVNPKRPFPRYPEYPVEFSSITESQRLGNRAFRERYRDSGRRIIGVPCTETSLSLAGRNLAQLKDLTELSWSEIDDLARAGAGLQRMQDVGFVTSDQYSRLGGWQAMNWKVLGQPSLQKTVSRKSRRIKGLRFLKRIRDSLVRRLKAQM